MKNHIKSFVITRFRQFEKPFRIEFGRPVTVLIGANNSGKSTILQALTLFQYCIDTCLKREGNSQNGGKLALKTTTISPDEIGRLPIATPSDLWPQGKISGKIVLEAGFEEDSKLTFSIEFTYNRFSIKPTLHKIDNIQEFLSGFGIRLIPVFTGLLPKEDYLVEPARLERSRSQRHGEIVRNMLYVLREQEQKRWKLLCDLLKQLYPDVFIDVQYDKDLAKQIGSAKIESSYKDIILKNSRDVIVAGSGFHQAVQIFAALLQPGGSVILLDEPDAHLHARLQSQLMKIFSGLAEKETIQFVIATHSPQILRAAPEGSILLCHAGAVTPLSSHPEHITVLEHVGALDRMELVPLVQTRRAVFVESSEDRKLLFAFAKKYFNERKAEEIFRRICFLYTHQEPIAAGVLNYARIIRDLLKTEEMEKLPGSTNPQFLVIADKDTRTSSEIVAKTRQIKEQTKQHGFGFALDFVFWNKTEIENYLLDMEAIARHIRSDAKENKQLSQWNSLEKQFREHLKILIEEQKTTVIERHAAHLQDVERKLNLQTAMERTRERLLPLWGDGTAWVDAKKVLSDLRAWLQDKGIRCKLIPEKIIDCMMGIPDDIKSALSRIKKFSGPTRKSPSRTRKNHDRLSPTH